MPAIREPLMEAADNSVGSSPAPNSTARRSGRVTKVPQKFANSVDAVPAVATTKRKRAAVDGEDAENESPGDALEGDGEEEDDNDVGDDNNNAGEDDEEEPGRRSKKTKKRPASQSKQTRKPAAKKPKINGSAPNLTNHASKLPSRPKKSVRLDIMRHDGDDLFAEIFGSGKMSDQVATDWYHRYQEDEPAAVTDLVNCILLAAGCDQQVTADDIQDPDNCQNRLADLQNVYTEEGITDYPLISRAKSTRSFRDLLVSFFKSLVSVMHETEVLYTNTSLMENIARWVASMSSSTLRPFRHTATTVALAMESALVEVSKKLDDRTTKFTQQLEAEKGRKGKNKDRLAAIQNNLDQANQNSEICQAQITDFFETVFVHRYRDVDAKIRTECVEALGSWVWVLPTVFMKPEYLRYLGWMLSDSVPQTRLEVVKQLARVFKRDAEKLGHFIDRFRPRLVEIATKDNDVSVRAAAIDVIEILKGTGNLEPDEIDAIGKLIFDSELRIRKAVISFFVDCVNDSIESKIDDMGGNEAVEELFGDEGEDDFDKPRRDWISIKCLGEILAAYETQLEEEQQVLAPRKLDIAVETMYAVAPVSRISLAAQVLHEKVEHVRNWDVLCGYLLYDHSTSSQSRLKSTKNSNDAALSQALAPEGQEDSILLEVLATAVKLNLSSSSEADKAKKKSRVDDSPENTALKLAGAIPRLLRKFGSDPSMAVTVLRLEYLLDLETLQHLRQDASTYSRLLDEICTQFNRHVDRGVISASATALLHARRYPELEEMVDAKVSVLWENVINSLRNFDRLCELGIRGNLDQDAISELGNVLMKISNLAFINNCVDLLETEGQTEGPNTPVAEILARIVQRGKIAVVDEDLDDPEDEAISFAIKSCHLYFMWKVRSLVEAVQNHADISSDDIETLDALRAKYSTNLILTFASRGTNDDLRLFATGALCDLHVLFASLRQAVETSAEDLEKYRILDPLFKEMRSDIIDELIEIFTAAETAYAKRARKTLFGPAEDEDPMDDEISDDEDEADLSPDQRKVRELKAENVLCQLASKFTMAILGKMVDGTGLQAGKLKRRMLRNQNKLGPNFKEVLAHLDEGARQLRERAAANKKKDKGKQPAPLMSGALGNKAGGKKNPLSAEIVVADEDSELENPFTDSEPEEGTMEDLRRRELLDEPDMNEEEEEEEDRGGPSNSNGAAMDEDESILGD